MNYQIMKIFIQCDGCTKNEIYESWSLDFIPEGWTKSYGNMTQDGYMITVAKVNKHFCPDCSVVKEIIK